MEVKVSFCTTAKGRLHHVRQTLPNNLEWNTDYPLTEFVLLDYASDDGLGDWVRAKMMEEIESGRLVYYRLEGYERFRHNHARNISHRLATGTIVCSLDADNFTGPGLARILAEGFETEERVFFRSPTKKGANGRIAFQKSDFLALGGYDERFVHGWGHGDKDIMARARALGIKQCWIPEDDTFPKYIRHRRLDSVRFAAVTDTDESRALHRKLSAGSMARGEYVANAGKHWGAATGVRNFCEPFEI